MLKLSLVLSCLFAPIAQAAPSPGLVRSAEFLSPIYKIDKIYRSMLGPHTLRRIELYRQGPEPELLWLVGFNADVVKADGRSPEKKEFMCHINLDLNAGLHQKRLGLSRGVDERIFTLSQGFFDIRLPSGFGVPIYSDEPVNLFTQVLNNNDKSRTFSVRHKVRVDFIRERERRVPFKPLFTSSAFVMALLEGPDGHFSLDAPDKITEKSSCLPGAHAPGASMGIYDDPYGRRLTGHWVLKPGREVRRTLVTKIMRIPYDTTLHYAVSHLHPFAESLELRDLTAGRSLVKTAARSPEKGIGLEHIDHFSSASGVPVYRDHQYELVSVYRNTSNSDQDSMASMFLYLEDKEFLP